MDIKELGFTKEEVLDKLVDKMFTTVMEEYVTEPLSEEEGGGEGEYRQPNKFQEKLQELVEKKIDATVDDMAKENVLPNVETYIKELVLQQTNQWGERTGEPVTFLEYMVARAKDYMSEEVDFQGKTKSQSRGYGFNAEGTRIAHMIHKYLRNEIENFVTEALKEANNSIAGGIEKAVKIKLDEIKKKIKITTKIDR